MSFVGWSQGQRDSPLPSPLRARIHGNGTLLRQRRRIVRPIARHRNKMSLRLIGAYQVQLGLRQRLGQEVVHTASAATAAAVSGLSR